MRLFRPVAAAALAVGFVVLGGCGPSTTTVKGKVTHKGKPVVWGSVTLADAKGQYHQGEIELDGSYTIDNVPVGQVKIGVYSPKPDDGTGRGKGRGAASTAGSKGGAQAEKGAGELEDPREKFFAQQGGKKNATPERPKPAPGQWFPIPDKATDPLTSGMTGTVKAGEPLDIDVK
jgi:hypothetical protein